MYESKSEGLMILLQAQGRRKSSAVGGQLKRKSSAVGGQLSRKSSAVGGQLSRKSSAVGGKSKMERRRSSQFVK